MGKRFSKLSKLHTSRTKEWQPTRSWVPPRRVLVPAKPFVTPAPDRTAAEGNHRLGDDRSS